MCATAVPTPECHVVVAANLDLNVARKALDISPATTGIRRLRNRLRPARTRVKTPSHMSGNPGTIVARIRQGFADKEGIKVAFDGRDPARRKPDIGRRFDKPAKVKNAIARVQHQQPLRRAFELRRLPRAEAPEIKMPRRVRGAIIGQPAPPGFIHKKIGSGGRGDMDAAGRVKQGCACDGVRPHVRIEPQPVENMGRFHAAQHAGAATQRCSDL